jgi:hypothetical protein
MAREDEWGRDQPGQPARIARANGTSARYELDDHNDGDNDSANRISDQASFV